jgi:hypothetical protein
MVRYCPSLLIDITLISRVLLAVLVSPPPATVAVLVTLAGALLATLTVRVSAG